MNAKPPSLAELHRQRAELLRQEAELWAKREEIGRMERQAEKDERALLESRPMASSSIENWLEQGAIGPFPGLDSMAQARLQETAIRAREVLGLAAKARAALDELAAVIAVELESNRIAIEAHGGNLRKAS